MVSGNSTEIGIMHELGKYLEGNALLTSGKNTRNFQPK